MGDNAPMKGQPYLRNLLLQRHEWMEAQVLRAAGDSGYSYITPGLSRLFAHMWGQPVGLSELARRMGITRQGVHKLGSEAARRGLVEFIGSTDDARVVMLQFTADGWAMSENAARDFTAIEAALARRLGPDRLALLKELLETPWDETDPPAT